MCSFPNAIASLCKKNTNISTVKSNSTSFNPFDHQYYYIESKTHSWICKMRCPLWHIIRVHFSRLKCTIFRVNMIEFSWYNLKKNIFSHNKCFELGKYKIWYWFWISNSSILNRDLGIWWKYTYQFNYLFWSQLAC